MNGSADLKNIGNVIYEIDNELFSLYKNIATNKLSRAENDTADHCYLLYDIGFKECKLYNNNVARLCAKIMWTSDSYAYTSQDLLEQHLAQCDSKYGGWYNFILEFKVEENTDSRRHYYTEVDWCYIIAEVSIHESSITNKDGFIADMFNECMDFVNSL